MFLTYRSALVFTKSHDEIVLEWLKVRKKRKWKQNFMTDVKLKLIFVCEHELTDSSSLQWQCTWSKIHLIRDQLLLYNMQSTFLIRNLWWFFNRTLNQNLDNERGSVIVSEHKFNYRLHTCFMMNIEDSEIWCIILEFMFSTCRHGIETTDCIIFYSSATPLTRCRWSVCKIQKRDKKNNYFIFNKYRLRSVLICLTFSRLLSR